VCGQASSGNAEGDELAPEEDAEEGGILRGGGIEALVVMAVERNGFGKVIQVVSASDGTVDAGEEVEIAFERTVEEMEEGVEAGDGFAHWSPGLGGGRSGGFRATLGEEAQIIDGTFEAEDAGGFVIDFDGDRPQMMLQAKAEGTAGKRAIDVIGTALESEASSEEGENILGFDSENETFE
jgi:hypothetical protein